MVFFPCCLPCRRDGNPFPGKVEVEGERGFATMEEIPSRVGPTNTSDQSVGGGNPKSGTNNRTRTPPLSQKKVANFSPCETPPFFQAPPIRKRGENWLHRGKKLDLIILGEKRGFFPPKNFMVFFGERGDLFKKR